MAESSVNWQYFPRSQRPQNHLNTVVEAFKAAAGEFREHDDRWQAWAGTAQRKRADRPSMESRDVLRMVAPALLAGGYEVESPGTQLRVVVLWGLNGSTVKYYKADAKIADEHGRETVVEVEAGSGHANNRWRKDLMEACLMPYVDYLVIVVRNEYWHLSDGKPTFTQDFRIVTTELDALYESHRLQLPLLGIMVIGY